MLANVDLGIAFILVVLTVVLLFLKRFEMLPRKSWPFLLAALFGALAVALFRGAMRRQLEEQVKRKEDALKKRDAELAKMKADLQIDENDYRAAQAESRRDVDASKKQVLLIAQGREQDRQRVNLLTGDDLDREYAETMKSLRQGG